MNKARIYHLIFTQKTILRLYFIGFLIMIGVDILLFLNNELASSIIFSGFYCGAYLNSYVELKSLQTKYKQLQ